MSAQSPRITAIEWGHIETEDGQRYKDAKLWPGGGREWDWRETGTRHRPGVQPADADELVEHGAEEVVLSQGMYEALGVPEATVDAIRRQGARVHVAETREAVELYNQLVQTSRVAGLFHSTC